MAKSVGGGGESGASGKQDTPGGPGKGGYGGGKSGDGRGGAMGGASGGYNSQSALARNDPITSDALSRVRDYSDVDNSTLDDIGNFIAGQFGLNEIDPTATNRAALASGKPPGLQADWGFDPAGLIGGGIGMATGVPGLGFTADQLSRLLGRPLETNLGPNVIGGPSSPATPGAGAGGGGGLGGLLGAIGKGGGTGSGAGIGGSGKGGGTGIGQKPPITNPNPNNPVINQLTQNNQNKPPATTTPKPTAAPAPTYNWQGELAALTPQLRSDFNWNMANRGLTPGSTDVYGNTINWDDVFNSELQHRLAGVPLGTTTGTDKTMLDQALNQYLLPNFGSSALDDYQTQLRSGGRNAVKGYGLENEINNRFSPDTVQSYLDNVYNKQYGAAKQQIDNTRARGELNDLGYNAAIGVLGDQGTAGKSTLSDLAGSYLTTAKGTLNDALAGIYDKIGNYSLGSGYRPNADITGLRTQENTLAGNLGGQILGGAPSIFDPSVIFQKASSQQGATSTGTLSDALAQRNLDQTKGRGIGSQGAF